MEHEAAGGIVDSRAIFGRFPVLCSNLGGQPTDALLHALVRSGKMESRTQECVISITLCAENPCSPVNTVINHQRGKKRDWLEIVCECSFFFLFSGSVA